MKRFEGRVAVVTGAASGIGLAMAQRFAAEKMKVVLADVEEAALDAAATELAGGGATVLPVRTDVSKADQVDALAEATLSKFGGVNVLCNNAGVGSGGFSWEQSLDDWNWVLGVNLWGVIHGIRAFVPHLIEQDEGHVVNTASFAGLTSSPFMSIYCVTKHSVVTLSECLHHELAMKAPHVRVSVVCPAWVKTNIHDSERNRPGRDDGAQGAVSDQEQAMQSIIKAAIDSGKKPEDVADQVFQAVRDDKFYVITHPEWLGAVKKRVNEILEGRTPTFAPPG